jgi:hypothetical protein
MTINANTIAEHETRERLGVCLMRLGAMKPHDLAHPPHSKISFRSGLPYFERSLGLFRKVGETNLREVPSEYLKIVADDAQETLARLTHIQNFTGEGVEHPEQVRIEMLTDLRDSLPPIYEDLSAIIKQPSAELERVNKPRSGAMLVAAVAVMALVTMAAVLGYEEYRLFAEKILSAIH